MSDLNRATLITVGATKTDKNKTVRLTINLDESNESKYPELNYKELVKAEVRKKVNIENGKTAGLNPFSDNDEDVERVARKFEQKYGGNSTYGKKDKSKLDDFADIGAGYDENDSFIDNTDGYDEMIPPECETFHGGFYINSGLLEFKNAENQPPLSDGEVGGNRRNKRRISSSSSDDDSSDSSSESESQDEKDTKVLTNGTGDSHKTEHRKKKNKKNDKKKAKKVRRTDSSAATSGKQTSDDNGHADGESVDSRTSQSDSLTSKPAPSSENAITSDSSRDVDAKADLNLPTLVAQVLEELEAAVSRLLMENPNTSAKELESFSEKYILKLDAAAAAGGAADARARRALWERAARALRVSRPDLLQRAKSLATPTSTQSAQSTSLTITSVPSSGSATSYKRKVDDEDAEDFSQLTITEREAKIEETLLRLKTLIEERKPGMMANYNAECERVQEERKKIQIAMAAEGLPPGGAESQKRLPKRRFPWCPRARSLLSRLRRLAPGGAERAAALLACRALPLFPPGFVRMPTLLRQADLSRDLKVTEMKRQCHVSSSQSVIQTAPPIPFTEQIQFPSSLTVTTMKTPADKTEAITTNNESEKYKNSTSLFGNIINSFSISKDLVVEKQEDRKKDSVIVERSKEDFPPNNFGSITIMPVPNNHLEKNISSTEKHKEPLIRVKSPAALNEMVQKKEKEKALESIHKKEKEKALESIHKKEKEKALESIHRKEIEKHSKSDKSQSTAKEKRVDSPLHVDTSYQPKQKEPTPSPKSKAEEISQKQIETMRVAENNIPRPALVPVHHSPTFAKPDKRPPEVKKKKDLVIVSDLDPLADLQQEPVAVDDSSSDVEVVEDNRSEKLSVKSDSVPSKDKVSVHDVNHKKVDSARLSSKAHVPNTDGKREEKRSDKLDDAMKDDFNSLMKNLRDLENSQEPKFNSNAFGGVITSAQNELL